MVALILAAGYATRLYPYTENTAKPLLKMGDGHIIDHIVEEIFTLPGIERLIVVTNNRFYEQFEHWRRQTGNNMIKIVNDGTNSVEERLGAVGDISFSIEQEGIDDELLVIAGDNLFTYDLIEMYEYFKKVEGDCICVKEIDDAEILKRVGVCRLDKRSKVISFVEKPAVPSSNLAVYATYFFRKSSLSFIHDFLDEAEQGDAPGYFIEWLYKKTDIYAYIMNGECFDIGTVEAYERIRGGFTFK